MLGRAGMRAPDALTEALATIISALQPEAGLGWTGLALETAQGATDQFLRELRHHLHGNGLLIAALAETNAAASARLGAIQREHRLLKQLSHDLCERLRSRDPGGARDVARRFLAILLDHEAHEARVFREIVRQLDARSTGRYADALFERVIRDAARGTRAAASPKASTDLHSLHARLTQVLQNPRDGRGAIEVDHEHSCSR